MKRFHFQLETLLRLRKAEEERAGIAVAELFRTQRAIEDRIRRHRQNLAEGRELIRAAATGTVDLVTMQAQAQASMQVMRQASHLEPALAGLQLRLERARVELREFVRKRKAIELLRERRNVQWRGIASRADQKQLDDLAQRQRKEIV